MAERAKVKRKIVLLGDSEVGKTSLIRRYVTDKFDDKYITTIGTKVTKKELVVRKGSAEIDLTLMIWDVLGQKGYTSIQAKSYVGTDGVLFVCDLTRRESLDSVRGYWMTELEKVAKKAPAVLVGNKVDLREQRAISDERLARFASELGFSHFASSAKTGENVEALFARLGELVVEEVQFDAGGGPARAKEVATLTDACDRIMVDFVDSYGDQEMAMSIIRQQFARAGVTVTSPTKKGLLEVIDCLAAAERDFKSDGEVKANQSRRRAIVERVPEKQ
ncbi:MAG: GTP-binding protein [Euryarchaeota archaeon]|nr:GTP-binding protein [Euryarchaeota archaeon]